MIIIGKNPVLEALKFNSKSVKKIIILNNPTDKKINEIIHKSKVNNIQVDRLSKDRFEKFFNKKDKSEGISQGIIAEVDDFKYADFNDILFSIREKQGSTIVLLDEIHDPHNLGAIIRTSVASGIDALVLTEKNTSKVNHTVIKASSGATNHIRIAQINNIYNAIKELKESGFFIIGTALNAHISYFDFKFSSKSAIVFGNEGLGLRKNVLKLCDEIIKIPIIGNKINSLNVSVAAGVILYEVLRIKSKIQD